MLGFKSLRENFKHIYTLDYFKIRFLSCIKKIGNYGSLFYNIWVSHYTYLIFNDI